ncbi:hypothetical protein D1007_37961 [Hordeum vulgare]|uniref:Phosphorylated adapter RNA export protein n=1 Tax=Hordeum vulgare subsp. vulgare TaxID=112509 RepID=A0A8I6XYN5_HORVV|nr:uncharacterized protein LOC123443705 [Hordeum vulgare subsp. vulgare]KAE8788018.1 hypothetical protein D1007_37961 [Hordeum vulgare]KAI5001133.1 hypothetical protein ZWY2020_011092 [Hordeum vulgare]
MERGESILDAVLDEKTLDFGGDDVEMADAEVEETPIPDPPAAGAGAAGGGAQAGGPAGKKKKKRKSGRSKNRGRPDGPPTKIGDINRFVLDTCRRLKEKKSYLVWNAIGCLGVSAVSDLVQEVEAIQKCGGQTIADGSRFRTGGGILWNILKSREPKAYKEIMVKGRELEKQFMYTKGRPQSSRNEDASSQGSALVDEEVEAHDDPEHLVDAEEAAPSVDKAEPRKPIADRIRVPVAYDDLFEDGEIHEGQPQN